LGYGGPFIGNFFGGSGDILTMKEAGGMIYVSDPILSDSQTKIDLFNKYEQKFGPYTYIEWPLGSRYDTMRILEEALRAVGDNPTAIKDYLYKMPDFTGIIGTYRFDENGDITDVKPSIGRIVNGKVEKYVEGNVTRSM
jgi:ABC-type branched-subunit amino acid transport system substrate-binding protein